MSALSPLHLQQPLFHLCVAILRPIFHSLLTLTALRFHSRSEFDLAFDLALNSLCCGSANLPSCPRTARVLAREGVKHSASLPLLCCCCLFFYYSWQSPSRIGSIAAAAFVLFPLIVQFAALLFSPFLACCCSPLLFSLRLLLLLCSLSSRQCRRHFNSFMILLARSSFSFALILLLFPLPLPLLFSLLCCFAACAPFCCYAN